MPRLMGMTQSAFDPASRFRFVQFIPHLRNRGWEVEHRPNRPDRQWTSRAPTRLARAALYRAGRTVMRCNRWRDVRQSSAFDVIFVNRDLAGPGLWLEKRLRARTPRIVYDFDDAIFAGPNERAVQWMCRQAGWITPGNEYLASYARRFNERVTVVPTVIDTDQYVPRSYGAARSRGRVRVGWSGSDQSIHATLVPRLEMLEHLSSKVDFELVVITNTRPKLPLAKLPWTFIPWREEDEPSLESRFDIGIMPLNDDAFQKGKCGLKLLQYMAAGLPAIASPVGVNSQIVRHCETGMLARHSSEWHQALETLIRDPRLRAQMGLAGRKVCELEFSIRQWLPRLIEILETVRRM